MMTLPKPPRPVLDRADRVGQIEPLTGRAVVVVNEHGSHTDFVAASELEIADGFAYVWVTSASRWYVAGIGARLTRWPAGAVWVLQWSTSDQG
jgi:hypothetical protein